MNELDSDEYDRINFGKHGRLYNSPKASGGTYEVGLNSYG